MIATIDYTGIGTALIGLATLVTAINALRKVKQIDHAVNGKAAGAQSMQSQVSDLHDQLPTPVPVLPEESVRDLLRRILAHLENGAANDEREGTPHPLGRMRGSLFLATSRGLARRAPS